MSNWFGAINHRKVKLENVLVYLLRCILLQCHEVLSCATKATVQCLRVSCRQARCRQALTSASFCGQPPAWHKKSATATDLSMLECQSTMKKSSTTSNLASLDSSTSSGDATDGDHCMICLDNVRSTAFNEVNTSCNDSSPIVLQCKHAFHRKCIFEWLLFQYECALCRAQVGPTAVINYCRLKNQVQWWLGDFKEEPLTSADK